MVDLSKFISNKKILRLLPKATTLLNKINITTYFENLTIKFYVLYALNTHVKFCINQILFTVSFISLYLMHNFKLQKIVI